MFECVCGCFMNFYLNSFMLCFDLIGVERKRDEWRRKHCNFHTNVFYVDWLCRCLHFFPASASFSLLVLSSSYPVPLLSFIGTYPFPSVPIRSLIGTYPFSTVPICSLIGTCSFSSVPPSFPEALTLSLSYPSCLRHLLRAFNPQGF